MKCTTLLAAALFASLALTSCSDSPSVAGDYVANLQSASSDAQPAASDGDATGDASPGTQTPTPTPATPAPSTPTAETPAPATPSPTNTTESELTYANLNAKVFVSCTPCHGNSGNVNLESYKKVQGALTDVKKEALTKKSMPPGAPLSADQQKLLSDWIAAGAPEK